MNSFVSSSIPSGGRLSVPNASHKSSERLRSRSGSIALSLQYNARRRSSSLPETQQVMAALAASAVKVEDNNRQKRQFFAGDPSQCRTVTVDESFRKLEVIIIMTIIVLLP